MKNFVRICLGAGVALLVISSVIFAQESASSASVSRSRALAAANSSPGSFTRSEIFVAPDEVAVEEFINYHRHRLPLPKAGESVAVEARWGNDKISRSQDEAILQIGFTTAFVNERTDLRPLNLALVIDKSGSMASSDKMSRVKESLRTMISQLRPNDIVSIIVFDSEAQVLCAAAPVGNGRQLARAIDLIQPNGSTNLHAGLMLGYRESKKNFEKDATNRVILLTDGIANVGTIDPKQIAAESSEFNDQGMDLSTIGVGIELDRELLRTLSRQGRGLFHFVADAHDIEKVFVKEVQSLISPVARRVNLEVEFDPSLKLEKVFGYQPEFTRNKVSIPLDDMNNGLTQIVLMRFRLSDVGADRSFPVRVSLSYFDIKSRKQVRETQTTSLGWTSNDSGGLLSDPLVRQNYTIAELAQSLYEMSEAARKNEFGRAENYITAAIDTAYLRYPNMEDQDIRFILDIVESYQTNLRAYNRDRQGDCGNCR